MSLDLLLTCIQNADQKLNDSGDKMKMKTHRTKELHLAVPLSLFMIGIVLIAGSLFFILRPYYGFIAYMLSNQSSSQVISKTKPVKAQSTPMKIPTIVYSGFGKVMGNLTLKSALIENYPVYHGDGNPQLRDGIGQFTGGCYPGEGGKVVLDAHRETFFRNLKLAKIGDLVYFNTCYGKYIYKVNAIKILKDTDTGIINPDYSHEYLVMYTCYPFNTIGYHPQRYVVYANLVSGTKIRVPKY